MPDVGVLVDVELDQQIVVARGGIDLGGDLGLGKRVGDGVGLAELAFELHEKRDHRCHLRSRRKGANRAKNRAPWQANLLLVAGRATRGYRPFFRIAETPASRMM